MISERHAPRLVTTSDVPLQLAETQEPLRRTCDELEHARHFEGPEPEQLEQLESQDWQELLVLSKYWVLPHVGKQRPSRRTGLFDGHEEHWLKEVPEHVAQSG